MSDDNIREENVKEEDMCDDAANGKDSSVESMQYEQLLEMACPDGAEWMESKTGHETGHEVEHEIEFPHRTEMKRHVGVFFLTTFLYSYFYTWGLHDSKSGLMALLFSVLTVGYFYASVRWMGFSFKRWQLIFPIAMILLGISQIRTCSDELHAYNGQVGLALVIVFLVTACCETGAWNLFQYLSAGLKTLFGGLTRVGCLRDALLIFQNRTIDEEQREKNTRLVYSILLGLVVGVPLTAFMFQMLLSSDAIFAEKSEQLLSFSFSFDGGLYLIEALLLGGYLYCALGNLAYRGVETKRREKMRLDAAVAITIYAMLTALYLLFTAVQFGGLILRKLELPEGYTYAEYAREGYFSLLVVCALNIVFVVVGKLCFQRHTLLQILLNVICGCTIVMIASSALKMSMYIDAYGLTRLRYKVVVSLVVEGLVILGTILWVNLRRFPLLFGTAGVFLVAYLFYSLSLPDYQIARYNLAHFDEVGFHSVNNTSYCYYISYDAIPAIVDYLNEQKTGAQGENADTILQMEMMLEGCTEFVQRDYSDMEWKDTNFSLVRAAKALGID